METPKVIKFTSNWDDTLETMLQDLDEIHLYSPDLESIEPSDEDQNVQLYKEIQS